MSPCPDLPLMPFDATWSVFHPRSPPLPVSSIDVRPQGEAPRLSFSALQRIRIRRPFFSPSPFGEGVFPALPCVGRSTVHRVWLPSQRIAHLEPLEAYFILQRSWASLFRAFFPHRDRTAVSSHPLRSCAWNQNLPASALRSNGLIPRKEPSSYSPPTD